MFLTSVAPSELKSLFHSFPNYPPHMPLKNSGQKNMLPPSRFSTSEPAWVQVFCSLMDTAQVSIHGLSKGMQEVAWLVVTV